MFAALIVFLLLGYPVAFSLAANGLVFALVGIELGLFQENFLQAMPERVYGTMNNDVLLAIPFFTFMGLILERSGMAEDLLDTMGQLFGPLRGGLAYSVVFVGALLAATTGVVAASVISMGLISLPIMLRYGYDRRLASGVIAASGTLAQIIPPSLVLIVLADQLGRSVGDMYEAAFIPGLVLAGLYAGYIFLVSLFAPNRVPGLPPEAQTLRDADGKTRRRSLAVVTAISFGLAYAYMKLGTNVTGGSDFAVLMLMLGIAISLVIAIGNRVLRLNLLSRMAEQAVFVMVPPLALVFLVLGTIFIGVATPTEAGAMGAAGAIILAYAKRAMTFDLLKQAVESTAKLAAFVLFILLGARVFALTFYGVNGHIWVEHLLVGLPGGAAGFLVVVNVMVFLLAIFLDFFELAFIVVPLLAPAADKLGIDLIWFGVILAVNMQTSFMTAPFGFALFFLRSVAPKSAYIDKITGKRMEPVTTGQIYWGAVPFVVIQCIMVALVILFPQMVMHYKSSAVQLDQQAIDKQFDSIQIPGMGDGGGLPGIDFSAPPSFK
ncbi:C4-dicarboxylate ABC transporter [Bosea sp. Root381]|nr:C4-dicarboxylate ABC transporter [Bosea sp. Root381]